MQYITSQLVGGLAWFLGSLTYHQESRKKYFIIYALSALAYMIHYLLLGFLMPTITTFFVLIRCKLDYKKKYGTLYLLMILNAFLFFFLINTTNYVAWPDIILVFTFPIMGLINRQKLKTIRYLSLTIELLFFLYSIYISSVVLLIDCSISLINGLLAIYRFRNVTLLESE